MKFKPHSPKQEAIFLSKKRYVIAATGIQWGKTVVGVLRLIDSMFRFTAKTDSFLVTSPTYKILYQSTLPVFNKYMASYGKYDHKNELFRLINGGTVYFRTGQNPDSVVGITDIRHILCDECGLYSRYFWENIQARSSIKESPITMVSSPYSLNWMYTDFIRKHQKGDPHVLDICELAQARSDENPYFPPSEYEEKRKLMDPRRFNMIYAGSFDKAQGLVYQNFEESKMAINPIKLPPGTRFFGGIDWGFTDPLVIKIRAVTEDGMHYAVDEFYRTQMHEGQILEEAARLKMLWNVEKYYCDPSRPDHISFLNSHGVTSLPANNDIEDGIEAHYALIENGDYLVFRASNKYTLDEYETYHYPEPKDLKPDQNQSAKMNIPVDSSNHCMDAERYITMGTRNIGRRKNRVANNDGDHVKTKTVDIHRDLNRDKLLRRKKVYADL